MRISFGYFCKWCVFLFVGVVCLDSLYFRFCLDAKGGGKKVREKNIEGVKVGRKWMESKMTIKLFGWNESE